MKASSADWELYPEPPYGYPDLDSVIDHAREGYITPRKRPDQKLNLGIRGIPADIWDVVFLIKEKDPRVDTMSLAEGCLIRCGLRVIEDIFQTSERTKERRLIAIETNNADDRETYGTLQYTPIHLGKSRTHTVTVFTLDEQDRARIAEISHTYGLPMTTKVAILAMAAGIAQATSLIPEPFRKRTIDEMEWLKRSLKS